MLAKDEYYQIIEAAISKESKVEKAVRKMSLEESEKTDVLNGLEGNRKLMNYLLLFEEFLDQHDVYMFEGWEKAKVVSPPVMERYWFKVLVMLPKGSDLHGAKRVKDANPESLVKVKKNTDGTILVGFEIRLNLLDKIFNDNKDKIENLSDQAMEEIK